MADAPRSPAMRILVVAEPTMPRHLIELRVADEVVATITHVGCRNGIACDGGPVRECLCRCHWYDDPIYGLRGHM